MKTLETFFYSGLKSLHFGKQLLRYRMVFLSAFFRSRASLGYELVAMRSQLTFYKGSIRHKKQPRPRFHPAYRLLWVLMSRVWGGWKFVAGLMKPKTVLPFLRFDTPVLYITRTIYKGRNNRESRPNRSG